MNFPSFSTPTKMKSIPETIFLCVFLAVSIFRWTYTDIQGSETWDLSTMPSFFGPGTYIAWIITGIDAFWDEWAEVVPWRVDTSKHLPESQQDTQNEQDEEEKEKAKPKAVLQVFAFTGYAAVALIYLGIMVVKEMPSTAYGAHTDAFYLIANTVFVVAYPCIDIVFPTGLRLPGLPRITIVFFTKTVFAVTLWLASYNALREFSNRVQRVSQLVLTTFLFMSLMLWDRKSKRRRIDLFWTWTITASSSLAFKILLLGMDEEENHFEKWSEIFRLRAPKPRTLNTLSELDQWFTVGLAAVCFVYSRQDTVLWTFTGVYSGLQRGFRRAYQLFTTRDV
ncbi:unnamed protein product [Periconia digitata]|uniref:Uncharacterized protein n=1 Tax=Periconia digitata TaxID=1303443 RepID=A0A9W4U8M9_9PLEO|nr:unnamed protein product [Periconia digitata]